MLFRLSDIQKSYGGNEVLRGVSFQINPNEKVGLVGRNGAGKTTVFRIITGEEAADEGEVFKLSNLKIGLLQQHVDFTDDETVHTAALSAFERLHDIEAEMRHLEVEMATNATDEVLEKYADLQIEFENADGFTYSKVREYTTFARLAIKEMFRQTGDKLIFDENGILQKGLLIRLLVLPNDIAGIAKVVKSFPDTMLIVDTVSSLSTVPVEMDANGIDGMLAGVQKALALPPGLAVFAVTTAILHIRERSRWDRREAALMQFRQWIPMIAKDNWTELAEEQSLGHFFDLLETIPEPSVTHDESTRKQIATKRKLATELLQKYVGKKPLPERGRKLLERLSQP